MASFGTLYKYNTNGGSVSVVPDTSEVRTKIIAAMVEIFGNDISTDSSTCLGRIIDALTYLFVDVLGVNAQNASNFNPNFATGNALDAIGNLFGISRPLGMSDSKYRELIANSQSRGAGYVQSIRNTLSLVPNITSICVLENGYADAKSEPNTEYGIAVAPHSVFIAVAGGDETAIANAVYSAKSAGCGYTTSNNFGTAIKKEITIQDGTNNSVVFYRPVLRDFDVYVNVLGSLNSSDTAAVKSAVIDFFKGKSNTCIVYAAEIIAAVARGAGGVVCTGAYMVMDGESTHRDTLTILPYQYCNIGSANVIITES